MKLLKKLISFSTLYIIAVTVIILIILYYASTITYQKGIENLANEGSVKLELHVTYLDGVLEKYESLPELLASDERLINYLIHPGGQDRIAALNKYLETINRISDASDTYLMDRDGLTIAASNWNEPRPFVGRNFSYRPYFKEAMRGRLGHYFALGTTSIQRGYYFAYPVRHKGEIIGVLAIKIGIDSVEQSWGHKKQSFLVTDPDGVIFFTTNHNWRFKTLFPLAEKTRKRIVESRRYPNTTLEPISMVYENTTPYGRVVKIKNEKNSQTDTYLLQSVYMEQAGWNVQILSETVGVERFVLLVLAMFSSIFILGGLVHLLVRQRKQRLLEVKKFEDKSRKVLEDANERLESRVNERTKELTKTNLLLRGEVEDRRRAEAALKKTRSELIHAAKLAALGQMSAGINHELNQPLAAIRCYTDNCKLFLSKERFMEVQWNLEQISELTDRMARIGVQLKLFSRKTSGQITIIPLHSVIDGALEILRPALRKITADIQVSIEPESLEVKANNVLLQQVLVNLISNALQAIENQDLQEVRISAKRSKGKVMVTIEDTGSGIDPNHLPHIFEPFYTTKKSGQGLGLGLTITERILKDMNGEIRIGKSIGGTRFEFFLEEAE
ncbi:ATP-binding protein [Desulfopila inferna]|uniref:ATP-binding protein n=1 Tax=Desulfopila inferna TaxID=468528 RepID=UPI001962E367|nr:ATP-binding protein [Desulfopila inferna]MBM9602790.1 sensor histidine kinase [Desulfopila inferna]